MIKMEKDKYKVIIGKKTLKDYLAVTIFNFQRTNMQTLVSTYRHAGKLERIVQILRNCNFINEPERTEGTWQGKGIVQVQIEKIPASQT